MVRYEPFPAPADPERPDLNWAMDVFTEWHNDGQPELDGAPAEQWKIAMAVVRGDKRASRQPDQ
jgi:hypothetical protein